MPRLDHPFGRLLLPVLAGACGAILYIVSPLSHQAFCSPLNMPVILAPEGAAVVPGEK